MDENRDIRRRRRRPLHAPADTEERDVEQDADLDTYEEGDYEYDFVDLEDGPRPNLPPAFPLFGLSRTTRIVATVICVLVALVSFFFIADYASSPTNHSKTINALDEKKSTVMGLVGASSASSTAITLIPGDAGTPIAEKLVDLSSDFLVVIAALYLEKYLLTVAGFVAFKILVPVSCLLFIGFLWLRQDLYTVRMRLAQIGVRLLLLGICMYAVVPTSVFISSMIEATYKQSIDETIAQAESTSQRIEEGTQAKEQQETDLLTQIQNLPDTIAGNVVGWVDEAKEALNGFVEALAVMVVTSCVIPLLVLVFFLWLMKAIIGVKVDVPMRILYPRTLRRRKKSGSSLMKR